MYFHPEFISPLYQIFFRNKTNRQVIQLQAKTKNHRIKKYFLVVCEWVSASLLFPPTHMSALSGRWETTQHNVPYSTLKGQWHENWDPLAENRDPSCFWEGMVEGWKGMRLSACYINYFPKRFLKKFFWTDGQFLNTILHKSRKEKLKKTKKIMRTTEKSKRNGKKKNRV